MIYLSKTCLTKLGSFHKRDTHEVLNSFHLCVFPHCVGVKYCAWPSFPNILLWFEIFFFFFLAGMYIFISSDSRVILYTYIS